MSNKEFILKILTIGGSYLKMLLPILKPLLAIVPSFLTGWHVPQPKYMKKDKKEVK